MAKLTMKGLEEYEKKLLQLKKLSKEMIGEAVYEGAAVVADAVKESIEQIPIDERYVSGNATLYGITQAQKDGLRDGFGIAPLQDDSGYLHVKLGFDGYNTQRTSKHPNGQPNSMIARSVNSGTSFRQRIPFVDNAVRNARTAAEKKMTDKLDDAIGDVMQ